ncbi:MAG TPA: D-alanyl-D-alanine carboxypeptidase/D-alanyl-D-alanine-endopeptidase [Kofleriaceae bacterium]|jgi:D-alanyl-D-alanine carboxypeptidase/D-alanyl-D-alanine-endopeptidase (penicillin-binding protein 4)|nr:D-alanyl-D-alanine carboxypeptidase/D-alanyl-D-alanine-endopeptidase [Kofleriaceae bacterium]
MGASRGRTVLWAAVALVSMSADPARSQEDDDEAEDAGAGPAAVVAGPDRAVWLRQRIDAAIAARPALAPARLAVLITDDAGTVLYERDADRPYNLASVNKLATTAAALALLGPQFEYQTHVYAERLHPDGTVDGNLYLRGRGDPSLGTLELAALAREVWLAGVRSVRGGIVIDDGYFDQVGSPPHFDEQPKEQAAFRAPVSAVSINFNAFAFVVMPDPGGSGPAQVIVDPPCDYVDVQGTVTTVAGGQTNVIADSVVDHDKLLLKLSGQIRAGGGPERYRRRVADPLAFAGSAFRAQLRRAGVTVNRTRTERGAVPRTARILATRSSPPMAELVRGLGKYSNNMVAEMLLKTLGAEPLAGTRPATWDDGLTRVRTFLTERIGLPAGSFKYENGSGLFSASAFSARQVVTILAAGWKDFTWGPDLLTSLSIAGADGTLRRRMRKGPATLHIRAKTGTLAQTVTLAGYAGVEGGRPLFFAVLVNDLPKRGPAKTQARALMGEIGDTMAAYLGAK